MHSRIVWADHAKAFSIFLMVLLHYGLPYKEGIDFVSMFHMPIFFFISGYFDKGNSFSIGLLKKNFRTLLIPYFFFSICAFSICWISPYIHPELYNYDHLPRTFLKAFVGMFLMQDRVRSYAFMPLGPLWFLVALFEVRILLSLFWELCKRFNYFISLLLLIIIFVLGIYYKICFFSLDAAAMALPIYYSGYLCKKYNIIAVINKDWQMGLLFIAGVIYLVFVGMRNGSVSMDGARFGNSVIMFYINAILGSLTVIFMFKALNLKWNWLSVVGASTLTILGTHTYINKIGAVIAVLFFHISDGTPLWFLLPHCAIGIAFGVLCHKLIMKYIPCVLGK